MTARKFFICKHCGNIVGKIVDQGTPLRCCNEEMQELIPNTVDASQEKHVPVITVAGKTITVRVGSADHPMLPEHYIQWIYLETTHGGQRKVLHPSDAPNVTFLLTEDDEPIAAYAYCNLHGLWTAKP